MAERGGSAKAVAAQLETTIFGTPSSPGESLDAGLRRITPVVDRVGLAVGVVTKARHPAARDFHHLADCVVCLRNAEQLKSVVEDEEVQRAANEIDFERRFLGPETDWASIAEALTWTGRLIALCGERSLAGAAICASEEIWPREKYKQARVRVETALKTFLDDLKRLESHFDPDLLPFGRALGISFDDLLVWTRQVREKAETATAWLAYQDIVRSLEDRLGGGTVGRIRAATDDAGLIPLILERRALSAWLDETYRGDPALRTFAAPDQQALIEEFRDLDRAVPGAARNEIRKRAFESYPTPFASSAHAGETSVLTREITKRRNQLPVRRLFQRIPTLVQRLKPCFMMSPLAVSQYLPRGPVAEETLAFDAVIFDEASQVFPEDAIPAIARARQVIVVGDSKQLPPTGFFRKQHDDDDDDSPDDDDELDPLTEDGLKDRESILDALKGMIGAGVGERHLRVHYRSKHEDLIHFSNHYFYDDRLLIFPSPYLSDQEIGVRDIYVPEGRYDSGGSRTNAAEAERAVDLVFELMRDRPDAESIGVVALSRAQADRIEALLEERRREARDLDDRFNAGRHEPFFVKNLENVQGDERDHIILSVGYGPTVATGKVVNRFGPINSEGGGRRLNVAVTRAKKSMTLIHSLRATDIVSTQPGPQLLRRYIEFAENPRTAIEALQTFDPDAEVDSAFEAAVKAALEQRGHRVQPQVGVSGYRIDLGIYSADQSRFDLAVECDGYTYHSSPAARDRDWLRQQILEGLGWTFVRVWSTAWAHDPKEELRRIEEALEQARSHPKDGVTGFSQESLPSREAVSAAEAASASAIAVSEFDTLFEDYKEADLSTFRTVGALGQESDRTLHPMLLEVCRAEGPVHFEVVLECLRNRYSIGRAGDVIRERVRDAIRTLAQQGAIVMEDGAGPEDVYVSLPQQPVTPRRPSSFRRSIDAISTGELAEGLMAVARALVGSDRDGLIKTTAKQFGYERTGDHIREALESALDGLIRDGKLTERFGNLSCAD